MFQTTNQQITLTYRIQKNKKLPTYQHISTYINIYQHISTYINIYQHISTYINIYQHILTYINIYQHISTYINIYQHINIPTYQHINISTYQHTNISTYLHINISTYQHTNISTYPKTASIVICTNLAIPSGPEFCTLDFPPGARPARHGFFIQHNDRAWAVWSSGFTMKNWGLSEK